MSAIVWCVAGKASKTAANGAVTNFTYSATAPYWTLATTGTRWTKSYPDGLGRTIKVESGYNTGATPTTVSTVETLYAPCACTPVGKLWKTSLPYAPGGTVYWTEHLYDALGRTLQVKQPNGAGNTVYSYSGIRVTVTDPAGKWKKYENDALGNLAKVFEPRPGGGSDYVTEYTYSELGQLLTATMARPGLGSNPATVTQVRTWVYNANMQLDSVTHPESGTTTFAYNTDGTLLRKTDQKGQKIENTYDSEGRVTAVRRYYAGGTEDTCSRVDYYYGTQSFDAAFTANATGRVAAVAKGCATSGAGQLIEMYSYTAAGAVTKKRLRIVRNTGTVDKDVTYSYGTDGKLATILYPGASTPYTYNYDLLDRPIKMTGPVNYLASTAVDVVKDVVYGVAGNVTSMKYLQYENSGTPNYFTETKSYNALFQMTRQTTTASGGATAADIEYTFSSSANNGRITGRTNYVSGEAVVYSYDELNRLVSASISGAGGWGQSFTHDGFGNVWTQTVTKGTAPSVSLSLDMTKNRINSASWSYDGNGNTTSMTVLGGGSATMSYDIDNRMVTWTGAPGTEEYGYLADNKRVWKKAPSGAETVYFYGASGQKLATYSVIASPFSLVLQSDNVYFGGKLIRADGVAVVHDRLGSVVARSGCSNCSAYTTKDYFPYGDEIGTATSGNVDKFGTYLRDQTTGLDYADQRYFSSALGGRFLSADPYEASGGAGEPGSWNRYPYVGGDPVNANDPSGLMTCWQEKGGQNYPAPGNWIHMVCKSNDGQRQKDEWFSVPKPSAQEEAKLVQTLATTWMDLDERRDWDLMPEAVDFAVAALEKNEDCFKLFGTESTRQGRWNPLTVIKSMFQDRNNNYGSVDFEYKVVGAAALTTPAGRPLPSVNNGITGTRANIHLNRAHWNVGNPAFNASTLLHELGHVYNFTRGSGGFAINNRAELSNSGAFDDLIKEKCHLQ